MARAQPQDQDCQESEKFQGNIGKNTENLRQIMSKMCANFEKIRSFK